MVDSIPVAPEPFDLVPGERILRKDIHRRWGGRTQGGISPSRSTRNIFLFWSPAVGERHGYHDEFRDDGFFYYTGAGQFGDQLMRDVNLALYRHRYDGRAVHLFAGHGGLVEYVGELELDADEPYYTTEAPESGESEELRKVFVFRLRPVTAQPRGPRSTLDAALTPDVQEVPVERIWTERFFVNPSAETREAERREQALVNGYETFLRRRGHDVARLKIVPTGEHRPLFCDLFDRTTNTLLEAKGSVTREAIRMAIGQLLDYARFAPGARLALLLPEQPRQDLRALLEGLAIEPIWPEADGEYRTTSFEPAR